jgi:ATP-binding cassette subfamily B protein
VTTYLVPEVIQTSGMDCGPACLTALLRGHGITASYGRLREACQTDVDGTSIDTLEQIAVELGLDAQQILVPVDHLLLPDYVAMPSIAVTRLPNGQTHFVVLWRRTLGRIQVMDPGRGRRWVSPEALADELYVHEMDVPAAMWREVAGTDDLTKPLATRLRAHGVADPARLIDAALVDPRWRPIAALDAATRMVAAIVDGDGLGRGVDAERLVGKLAAAAATADGVIPDGYWSARATKPAAPAARATSKTDDRSAAEAPAARDPAGDPTDANDTTPAGPAAREASTIEAGPRDDATEAAGHTSKRSSTPAAQGGPTTDARASDTAAAAPDDGDTAADAGSTTAGDSPPDRAPADGPAPDDGEQVRIRGAVLVHVTGKHAATPASRDLAAALTEPPPRPWRALRDALLAGGALRPLAVLVALAIASVGVVVEVALFRGLFEIGHDLATVPQLAGALAALVAFLVAMLLVEVPARGEAARLGRHTELRLRERLLAKLPRLGLHYIRSRPTSDMAERGHMLHRLRELPLVGARTVRATAEIVVTSAVVIALAPSTAPLAVALALASIVPPFVALGAIAERELRMRTHAGALSRFYLDALVGTTPARASGIDVTLAREHEGLLAEWMQAARAEHRLAIAIATIQGVLGFGLAIALVVAHAARGGAPASVLLLVYWALAIPLSGQALGGALREIPIYRNLTLRLLEPLGALEEEPAVASHDAEHRGVTIDGTTRSDAERRGVAIELAGVGVVIGGRPVLDGIDLRIAAGEHVAIVGPSGGGKSTLVGLMLGWARPAAGSLRVDAVDLDPARVAALRGRTVWIDPGVTLWNESLADNLAYAAPGADVAAAATAAELEPVIARLPEGLATRLGEGGGLVSGGEGQRVRLARGIAQRDPRLVVLDEPFRGLDRDVRHRQLAAARARWRDVTLLCVTHDVAETRTFPRVLVVEGGRIVEDGAPDTLAATDSRYAALLAGDARAHDVWSRWTRKRIVDGKVQ